MGTTMLGMMMDRPLLVSALIEHAARFHGNVPVVSREHDGGVIRTDWASTAMRARRLAQALRRLGVGEGDRVGTLAWNTHRHLELYFGVSGIGAVLHTVNPRLFREQVAFIINHAQDRVLFVDMSLLPLVAELRASLHGVEHVVVMAPRSALPADLPPGSACYEELLAAEDGAMDWPVLDERCASSLCYTSGTTGHPRGVLYSHRSTILHTLNAATVDGHGVSGADCILPAVPMFHGNAWGIPYSAAATGAKLVLAGQQVDGAALHALLEAERVTLSLGVPTVWQGLLAHLQATGQRLTSLRRVICGGSAVPPALTAAYRREHGVRLVQAWGMTEMSPLGATAALKHRHLDVPDAEKDAINEKQGRPPFLVDLKLVGPDGAALPHDGQAVGDLHVAGPWVASGYYANPEASAEAFDPAGWLRTGDVCTIDADGYIRIVDRSKDMVKSGGEWISSIALESLAAGHPDVAEAAVIAARHPKWDERPLLVVVPKPGRAPTRDDLLGFLAGHVARWWLPDDVVLVEELPHTATGKISKAQLRERFRDHRLPTA
jgi:fatty-acyl-CoA synthase